MNFIFNVLDSIPVVGHVKGLAHYAVGDTDGGNKAMYQSTRTSAVLAGGAAGCLAGGPAGAVAGGMYAGMATDGLASVAMQKPQGIIKSCEDVAKDLKAGKNPTGSIVSTGFQVGMDALGGFGMGGVSSAASQISEKAVAKTIENVGKKVASTVGEEIIEKSAKITAEEMAKMVTKKVSEQTVKQVIKQAAIQTEVVLVTTHVAVSASKRTENEDRAERDRRAREERERRERENRAREERERREMENRAREERERREMENRAREERERREMENRAREERERREMENRAREERERREMENRAREERERREMENRASETNQPRRQNRGRTEEQSRGRSGTSSGSSQPPQGNRNNDNMSDEQIESEFEEFMVLLERILKGIYGNETEPISRIFRRLSINQKRYLVKIIMRLKDNGMLDAVVELVIKLFKQHFRENISFTNFLSLAEFVAAYIDDELNIRMMISRGTSTSQRRMSYRERRNRTFTDIINQENLVQQLVDTFNQTRDEIEDETSKNNIFPNFRDIFAAVYHYWKHRQVPGDGTLSVADYYDYIRKFLEKLRDTPEYHQLSNSTKPGTCRYEVYVVLFGRRFRIVVKVYGGQLVLSSAYVLEIIYHDDKDGDVFIKLTFP